MWTFQPGDGRGLSRSGAEAAAKRAQLALCREVKGGDGSGKDGASGGPGDYCASSRRARRGRGEEGWGAVSMGAVSTPTGSWSFLLLTKLSF